MHNSLFFTLLASLDAPKFARFWTPISYFIAIVADWTFPIFRYNVKPLARILGFVDSAQEPTDWPTSPAIGIKKLLQDLKLKPDDIDAYEINEAFSVVVLANAKILGLDLDKVNVNGGAIGIGHPFGMSGARITNHLVHSLKEGQIGIASLCNGGGGASTIAIQKL